MALPARVLVLNERDSHHPKAGGAEVHVDEVFRRLASRGFEVTLATSSFATGEREAESGALRIRRLGRIPFYYPSAARYCARETRRNRFDVVVECLNKLPFYSPVYSAVPVLAIVHHLFGATAFLQVSWPTATAVWAMERMIPLLYRNTSFVSISESTRDDLVARGIAPERVEVHHCGIHRPTIELPDYATRELRVAYVGRLEPYKQIDVLLRAMARLSDRFPEARIDIIGRGSDRARLERIARAIGIAERTRFVGFVSQQERDRLLGSARVCVCPSAKEGWGLTVIEAAALATPVVATDAPGLRDSVEEGKTGFLVPNGDVDAFAGRIATLLTDRELARRMSAAALAWSQGFDWDKTANRMAESLEAVRRTA